MLDLTLGDKIRDARKAAGLTQKQLADKIGCSNTSISNWEKGVSNPDPDTIQNLCWALGVQPNYFFSVDGPAETIVRGAVPVPVMRAVPLLGAIACGDPILAEQNIEGFLAMPDNVAADFCLLCKGDSMINARIFDGDIVYIRQQESVENGEIAAVLIDNEATLKRVRLFEDHVSLEPENPQYRPIVLWNEDMNSIRILGKAVAFMSTVR